MPKKINFGSQREWLEDAIGLQYLTEPQNPPPPVDSGSFQQAPGFSVPQSAIEHLQSLMREHRADAGYVDQENGLTIGSIRSLDEIIPSSHSALGDAVSAPVTVEPIKECFSSPNPIQNNLHVADLIAGQEPVTARFIGVPILNADGLADAQTIAGNVHKVSIADFEGGKGGDVIDVGLFLGNEASTYQGGNPFADGSLAVKQTGNDAVLQWDADGAAGSNYDRRNLVTLNNFDATTLTAENFIHQTAHVDAIVIANQVPLDSGPGLTIL